MCTRHRHVMWSYNPTMQACELFDKKGLPYRLHTFASGVVVIKFCGAAGLSPSFACVCVCVCAYACAFACLCVCGCVCVCVCVSARELSIDSVHVDAQYMRVYTHAPCLHACMCMYAYIHTSTHPHMHTPTHPCIHTSIHAYMHTCIHAYMHTCKPA